MLRLGSPHFVLSLLPGSSLGFTYVLPSEKHQGITLLFVILVFCCIFHLVVPQHLSI